MSHEETKELLIGEVGKQQFDRIATALEGIAQSLETLAECVETNHMHSWLNINGSIETFEG